MQISPPGHLPGDPDAPREDYLGLAIVSVLFGVLLGAGLISGALWGVRTLQTSAPAPAVPTLTGPSALLLLTGTFGGVAGAAVAAWTLMSPIGALYRRGGLAVVSGFASLVVALIAMPVDQHFGREGLLAFAVACAGGCLWLGRRASRLTRAV